MALGEDPGHEVRASLDLLTDHEEGRARARARERLEHGRRPLGVRSIVEGQRDAADTRAERAREPERVGGGGGNRGEGVAEHGRMIANTDRGRVIASTADG